MASKSQTAWYEGLVLADAPPLPGEEARYAQMLALVEAAKQDPLKNAVIDEATKTEKEMVAQLSAAIGL